VTFTPGVFQHLCAFLKRCGAGKNMRMGAWAVTD
jgi:hypothetical protein